MFFFHSFDLALDAFKLSPSYASEPKTLFIKKISSDRTSIRVYREEVNMTINIELQGD